MTGIRCPKCGGAPGVVKSQRIKDGHKRYRKCECGENIVTVEMIVMKQNQRRIAA